MKTADAPFLQPSSSDAGLNDAQDQPLSADLSLRFALLRFPLIVAVLFIHSFVTTVGLASVRIGSVYSAPWSWAVRMFISQELCRVAVPAFFLIAGYLFFWNFHGTLAQYGTRLKKRIPTLLVPYVLWNVLVIGLYAALQNLPGASALISGHNLPVARFGAADWLDQFVGWNGYPAAYQFWFIRDLMVLVVLALPLYWALRLSSHVFMALMLAAWFLKLLPGIAPFDEPPLFFVMGAYLAYQRLDLLRLDRCGPWAAGLTLLLAALSVANQQYEYGLGEMPHQLMVLSGLVTVYWLAGRIPASPRLQRALLWAAPASFFVFAAHEPLLLGLRKLAYYALRPDAALALALYFIIPLVVISVCLLAWVLLRKRMPQLLAVLTGGRT